MEVDKTVTTLISSSTETAKQLRKRIALAISQTGGVSSHLRQAILKMLVRLAPQILPKVKSELKGSCKKARTMQPINLS